MTSSPSKNHPVLLVLGPSHLNHEAIFSAFQELGHKLGSQQNLDVLTFNLDPDGETIAAIRAVWPGKLVILDGAQYIAKIENQVRESITSFISNLRNKLGTIAIESGGQKWASKFADLWWMTTISEKNSPADDMWWQFFRLAAIQTRIDEKTYAKFAVVGDEQLIYLTRQILPDNGTKHFERIIRKEKFNWNRVLAIRAIGLLFYLVAILIAKWHMRDQNVIGNKSKERPTVAYSWYPRVWTNRFNQWKDMYYGNSLSNLSKKIGEPPVQALRVYDRTKFVNPVVYWTRIKMLMRPESRPDSYTIVESFGSIWSTIGAYLNIKDVFQYYKMTQHKAFNEAFTWRGLNVAPLFKDRIWRSVLISWPHLAVLAGSSNNLARTLKPDLVILYCFEFIYGRAIITGSRQGNPETSIIGVQHGPISPMKLLYSGTPDDRQIETQVSKPLPEPDIYVVDGKLASGILQKSGVPPSSLKTPGAARLDDVWSQDKSPPNLKDRQSHDLVRILIAPGLHDTSYVTGMTLDALGSDTNLELVLKPHPKIPIKTLYNMVDSHRLRETKGALITLAPEGNIYEWMAKSDIFLATYSSTAIEALAFYLPVILLIPNHMPDMSLFHGSPVGVMKATRSKELRDHVTLLSNDRDFARRYVTEISYLLEESFGSTDGAASNRLADIFAQLSHPKRTSKTSVKL